MERTLPRFWAPLAGVLAGGLGLAAGELWASVVGGAAPVIVVGNRVVDGVPRGVKTWAIETFGTNDKKALIIGVLVLTALYSAFVGVRTAHRFLDGVVGVIAFAAVGIFAAATARAPSLSDIGPIICALVIASAALWVLIVRPSRRAAPGERGDVPSEVGIVRTGAPTVVNRRQFFALGGGAAGATLVAATGARALSGADPVAASSKPIPKVASTVPAPIPATQADVPDMTPFITPNDAFYRIDTALVVPRVNATTWSLKVNGMVDTPLTISYEDLRSGRFGPLVEHDCTLMCVSNEVGGDLIGNARWTGVRLKNVLDAAGVKDGAEQIFATSVDGFTAGFPTKLAFDGREALVAIGMNGEPLPARHGYPVRLVVPGIYGYVSAVKWLEEIKLTTFSDDEGYWIPRGWATLAPIKTSSRIDVVGGKNVKLVAGKIPIAGVAWAQHTGIAKVEVRIDDEPWQEATLAAEDNVDTWRQWKLVWDAKEGTHTIAVRATDKSGFTQREDRVDVAPDGAEGYDSVRVKVSAR